MRRASRIISVVLLALLVCLPAAALADSFHFGGDNYLKAQAEGRLNPYWAPVTNTDPYDALLSGMTASVVSRFDLSSVFGVSYADLADGMTLSGIDYTLPELFSVSPDDSLIGQQAKNTSGYPVEFSGSVHLTSVGLYNDYISLEGYLSDLYLSPTSGSNVLASLYAEGTPYFKMELFLSDKAEINLVQALSSEDGSAFANVAGQVGGGGGGAVPEPGTMVLMFSSLAGMAGYARLRIGRRRVETA